MLLVSKKMNEVLDICGTYPQLFKSLGYFFITFIGAAITQLLSFHYETVGATPFLKKFFPGKNERWYFRTNCITLIAIGTILSFIILEPDSIKASFCAGLTWCGTLQSLGLVNKN